MSEVTSRAMGSEEVAMIEALPVLEQPYWFRSNEAEIKVVQAHCPSCREEIAPENLRGNWIKTGDCTVRLTAYGLCMSCKLIVPVDGRFCADGSSLIKGPDGWRESWWAEEKPVGVVGKLLAWLK